ncbi:ABC transporter ATP-binding protein [Brachyspira hampsonii]|uniref:Iron compound ABC transporter ATP-binding protein n=1 Tax=Brachyspira hampsonii 30446 TaxID=1289135 RepID=A0A2U4FGL5_9SPIR|nr:ABC transporter ATP-binding protein [Brachyspira hampsonii]EKV56291.1 iron compound ABC transporter ATP-binding protein [Brachyspira hampsonii 30446]PTY40380.1 iron ABC transporter ATP-binding protein [Brachyspira hampsonii bv. II]
MNDISKINKMVEVKNLSLSYSNKKKVLSNIYFDVNSNESLCIIGPNGCGKSTLLKSLCKIIDFDDGEILINNEDIKKIDAYKTIAMMSQMSVIYFGYTAYDTIMMGRYSSYKDKLLSVPSKEDKEFVIYYMEKLKIMHLKDKLITELSGGELQRIFLARTLVQDPSIILMDEPTNHLDLNSQIELIYNLKEWVKNGKRCIIAVLHDINAALNFADKLLILKNGSSMYFGNIDNFDMRLLNDVYDINVIEYMTNSLKRW